MSFDYIYININIIQKKNGDKTFVFPGTARQANLPDR